MRKLPLLAVVIFAIILAAPSFADVQGSPLIPRSLVDTCAGCLLAYIQFPQTDAGLTIESWSIYAQAENPITPILFEKSAGDNFQILAIGTEQTPSAIDTILSFNFGLVSGVGTIIDSNTYFGWRDGSADGSQINGGSIAMDESFEQGGSANGPGVYYNGGGVRFDGSISVGDQYTFTNAYTTKREYSVQATVTEPESIVSLLACLAVVAGFARLRRR
jgi:hypothetical protein